VRSICSRIAAFLAVICMVLPPMASVQASPVLQTQAAKLPKGKATAMDATRLEAIVDTLINEARQKDHFAGATVSIIQNGETRLLKGYGLASTVPARPVDPSRTLFRIGSVSKTITWILLLRLVEEGKVDLAKPVNDYLPAQLRIPDDGFRSPILVKNLLDHTPGFEDIALGHLFAEKPAGILPPAEYLVRHRPKRVREPGQFSTYSNYGVALAGAIIEKARGKDLSTVADEEFFGPLKMNNSTFREPYPAQNGLPAPMSTALAKNMANANVWLAGYYKQFGMEYITGIGPAGSISSTAADMGRYLQLLLNEGQFDGVRIYGPKTAKLLRTPLRKNAPRGVNAWAHGFMITQLPGGLKGYGHGGATQFFRTYMMVVPELNLGIFVSVNSPTGQSIIERLPIRLVSAMTGHPDPENIYRAGNPKLVPEAARYAGTYQTTRRAYSGLEKATGLLAPVNVGVDPAGYLITQMGPDIRSWVPTDETGIFVSTTGEDQLRFNLDASGNAASFDIPFGVARYERASAIFSPINLGILAALVTLISAFGLWNSIKRIRRKGWIDSLSRYADWSSAATSGAWLTTIIAGAAAALTLDPFKLLYSFPTPALSAMSALATASLLLSVLYFVLTALQWRNAKGHGRLTLVRRTSCAALFLFFSFVLQQWGIISLLS